MRKMMTMERLRVRAQIMLALFLTVTVATIVASAFATSAEAANKRLPITRADAYSLNEDTTLIRSAAGGVLKNDRDPDGNRISAFLVNRPAHGNIGLNRNGSFTYKPGGNYNGKDYFRYKACETANPMRCGATVTVSLSIAAVNDVPKGVSDTARINEDTTLNLAAPGVLKNDTDVDGDRLSVLAGSLSSPLNGSASLAADGSLKYTPRKDFHGTETLSYRVTDGKTNSLATISVGVSPVQDAPVARNNTYYVYKNHLRYVDRPGVLGNDSDVDGDRLKVVGYTQARDAKITVGPGGGVIISPKKDFVGWTSFKYRISDNHGNYDIATANVRVWSK